MLCLFAHEAAAEDLSMGAFVTIDPSEAEIARVLGEVGADAGLVVVDLDQTFFEPGQKLDDSAS